jgi:hypothetical protein
LAQGSDRVLSWLRKKKLLTNGVTANKNKIHNFSLVSVGAIVLIQITTKEEAESQETKGTAPVLEAEIDCTIALESRIHRLKNTCLITGIKHKLNTIPVVKQRTLRCMAMRFVLNYTFLYQFGSSEP